jgi:hypothetical protein
LSWSEIEAFSLVRSQSQLQVLENFMSYTLPCPSRRTPFPLLPCISLLTLLAIFIAGCGGGGGTGTTLSGNTQVVVLASSTANDQLSSFTTTLQSLTLTNQAGKTVNLLASPVSEEFIHLNGHVEPIATVNIPQGTYVSASATYNGGATPVCNAQNSGSNMTDGLTGGASETINLPNPITVDGTAMALVLDLDVSTYPEQCPTPAEFPSAPPVTAAFDLTPLTIAAQPTNSTNGLALGLEGTIGSVGSGAAQFTVNGLVNGQTPPTWQVSLNSSTVLQGISGAAQLTAQVPVDMDVAVQEDGSLVATRVSVISTETTTLTVASGPLMTVSDAEPVTYVIGAAEQGYLPILIGGFGYANFGNSQFQTPAQFKNLASLPFTATFNSAVMVPGQNVTVTTQATAYPSGPAYIPLTTMALRPQTINGTVSAISSEGGFTTYTVTLAPYDLFPQFAVQPGQTTLLTNPNTVVVYADSNTQMLNKSSLAAGSIFRFYGLVFNDNGTLRMDCAQINDGVPE